MADEEDDIFGCINFNGTGDEELVQAGAWEEGGDRTAAHPLRSPVVGSPAAPLLSSG